MPRIALLTQHNKAQALQPLAERLGLELVLATGKNTDVLGTFTCERERQGTQLEAALTKARWACELTGARYGLGSEGSFGPDPHLGLVPWGVEIVAWWDAERRHAVHGVAQGGATNFRHRSVDSEAGLRAFAEEVGFPAHGLVIGRPEELWFDKEAADWDVLCARAAPAWATGELWVETDMRAHRNPTRMRMIEAAGLALADRLAQACPACQAPGFGPVRGVPGARCEGCGLPTAAVRAEVLACGACGHEATRALRDTVSAVRCGFCNP
jgi:hypothetical protein